MRRVSVDIGGTFTDCFLAWDGKKASGKALTTHKNLATGFNRALENAAREAGIDDEGFLANIESIRYATTLGTNALIERSGPRVGLLTTAGFEATVPLSRGRGYGDGMSEEYQKDIARATRPEPLVPIPLIAGVRERIDGEGMVTIPLDEEDLRGQIRNLVDAGAQAFVVALVNSVVNPEHEYRVEEIILEEYPTQLLGAIPVTLSHLVSGRKSEYSRSNSAIINAYLHSVMYHGLATMEQNLRERGFNQAMMLVHNSGGMAQLNSTSALQTIHSGPIAGIDVAGHLGEAIGVGNVVCSDMGGTSFDIGLVVDGGAKFYENYPVIDRWLCTVPMVALNTLGSGGGSIAGYSNIFKSVTVGPQSAGSEPGPACYNKGGLAPTVTDADLVLGYLDPENYAGGTIRLNKRRAERALKTDVADPMAANVIDAALAVKKTVDTDMGNGIIKNLRARGYDPATFTMLAYGGNGPLHACGICAEIGIDTILVPPFSSVFSALGAGNIEQAHVHEFSRVFWLYDAQNREILDDFDDLNEIIEGLEERGRADMVRQGLNPDTVSFSLEFDMRYGNQLAHSSVGASVNRIETGKDAIRLIADFATDYQNRFGEGSAQPQAGVVITAVRVIASVDNTKIDFSGLVANEGAAPVTPPSAERRTCYFNDAPNGIETQIYVYEDLAEGARIEGPAVIVSQTTTCLVEPNWQFDMGPERAAWMTRQTRLAH